MRCFAVEDLDGPRRLVRIGRSAGIAEACGPQDVQFHSNNLLSLLWDYQGEVISRGRAQTIATGWAATRHVTPEGGGQGPDLRPPRSAAGPQLTELTQLARRRAGRSGGSPIRGPAMLAGGVRAGRRLPEPPRHRRRLRLAGRGGELEHTTSRPPARSADSERGARTGSSTAPW
jgi:hypothetical protein